MYMTNKPLSLSRYGISLTDVSVSAVTNTVAYDSLGRQIAHTDGRGNTRHTEYNALGQRSAAIDALGNRTSYAYDQFGNLAAVTNPLGHAIVYEYDLSGNKTYEGGATYPVRYTYDIFGNKTTMTTYRSESVGRGDPTAPQGDTTTWRYDIASGSMTNKVYADGKGPSYSYTPDGKLTRRTWARGVVTDYSYDGWNNLTNTTYSDDTPTISLTYDALGRQTEANDTAGATTFAYDFFGSLTNETVIGVAGTNTIERCWDEFGRSVGYSLNGTRQSTLTYDPATRRLAMMLASGSAVPFTWLYLTGSDLKSALSYPNGLTAAWTYDASDQLLQALNATPTNVISQYDYTYDAAGRRTAITRSGSMMSETRTDHYGYNDRNELVSGAKSGGSQSSATEYEYSYDDIGNRLSSLDLGTNRAYTANNLNQYAQISNLCDSASLREEFLPQFDDDGNQSLTKTATGVWQVSYNGENRPVLWECGSTNITMKFDRMGRRVEYIETVNSVTNKHHRFVYDGYLCIQRLNAAFNNAIDLVFGWDPSEPVATLPLVLQKYGQYNLFYTHDGNKNVSELVFFQQANGIAAHYEYAPFGAVTATSRSTPVTAYDFCEYNPFRFSSEYADDVLELIYYNYRHGNTNENRWMNRDILGESVSRNIYIHANNACTFDYLGLLGGVNMGESLDRILNNKVIDDYVALLKETSDAISKSGCKFIISFDSNQPLFTLYYDVRGVVASLVGQLSVAFPNNEVQTISNDSMDALLSTFRDTKCICGWIYIGHGAMDAGANSPPRLILNERESLVSRNPVRNESLRREDVNLLSNFHFLEKGASLLLACNSGRTSPNEDGGKSIAEAMSDATRTPVVGMREKVNFQHGVVKGASGNSAATQTFGN